MAVSIVTVSSKGQLVLPAAMRKKHSIVSGAKFAAYDAGDMIMLKPITVPTEKEFTERLDEARAWAESVGYEESDVNDIIKEVRSRKKT